MIAPRGAAVSISASTSTTARPLTSAGASATAASPVTIAFTGRVWARGPAETNAMLVRM